MSQASKQVETRESMNLVALMISMIVWIILLPILGRDPWPKALLSLAFFGMIAAAIQASAPGRRQRNFMLGIVAVLLITSLVGYLTETPRTDWMYMVAEWGAIFVLFVTPVWLSLHVLKARHVTLNMVFGALCAYFILGILWALLYQEMHLLMPDSFTWSPGSQSSITYVYFSFTTLTTLGYGDISPQNAPVRILATMQAFIGQIYLVVLVARLVSLHITDAQKSEN